MHTLSDTAGLINTWLSSLLLCNACTCSIFQSWWSINISHHALDTLDPYSWNVTCDVIDIECTRLPSFLVCCQRTGETEDELIAYPCHCSLEQSPNHFLSLSYVHCMHVHVCCHSACACVWCKLPVRGISKPFKLASFELMGVLGWQLGQTREIEKFSLNKCIIHVDK